MLPRPHANFGKGDPGKPIFKGGGTASLSAPVVLPLGTDVGDILVQNAAYGNIGSGAGWITAGGARWRRLQGPELAPAYFNSTGIVPWVVYRGIYSLALRTQGSAVGMVSLPGFTKAPNFAGLLIAIQTPAPTGSPPGAGAPSIDRAQAHNGGAGSSSSLSDRLDPADYIDGSSIACFGDPNFGSNTSAYSIEMLF